MKEICKKIGYGIGVIILLLCLLIGFLFLSDYVEKKYLYSIPLPEINGKFKAFEEYIDISGIENIVDGGESANLVYTELQCLLNAKQCFVNKVSVTNKSGVTVFPIHSEYIIKYNDKNKIIFVDYLGEMTGEIDLITKTVTYSTKSGLDSTPKKVEIVTDNTIIPDLERKIIKKYLRK